MKMVRRALSVVLLMAISGAPATASSGQGETWSNFYLQTDLRQYVFADDDFTFLPLGIQGSYGRFAFGIEAATGRLNPGAFGTPGGSLFGVSIGVDNADWAAESPRVKMRASIGFQRTRVARSQIVVDGTSGTSNPEDLPGITRSSNLITDFPLVFSLGYRTPAGLSFWIAPQLRYRRTSAENTMTSVGKEDFIPARNN